MESSTRILIGIAAGVILLVVLAIALPRLLDREEATYPPNTPEGTVQRYLQAVIDEDADTAIAFLTANNTTPCMEDEVRRRLRYSPAQGNRVRLGDVEEIDGDTITVIVRVSRVDEPGLFELPEDRGATDYEFSLQRTTDGFWLISESEWPMRLDDLREYECDVTTTPAPESDSS